MFRPYYNVIKGGILMANNKDLETWVRDFDARLSNLATTNSQLTDEVVILKKNYNRLVEDMNTRLKVVHENLFRDSK